MRAFRILEGNDVLQMTCFLYAHAKSAPGDYSIRHCMSLERMEKDLAQFLNDLPIHDGQLPELCERLREIDGSGREEIADPDRADEEKPDEIEHDNSRNFLGAMQRAFPGVPPDFWLTEIPANDARAMLTELCEQESTWAESPARKDAIKNYLKAVRWVWLNHNRDPDAKN
jgi:hypothetical protein